MKKRKVKKKSAIILIPCVITCKCYFGHLVQKKGKKKKKNVTKTLHFQAFDDILVKSDDILVKSSYSFIKPSFVFFSRGKKV